MKHRGLIITALTAFAIVISGCPTGIAYPAGYPGKEKIDKDLIGTWYNHTTENEANVVTISKVDDFTLKADVVEPGSMYSLDAKQLNAWCTEIGGLKFVYMQPISETEKDYFIYCYKVEGNKLETYNISLLDGGIDAVTSTETYRAQIETSIKMAGGISDTIQWMKR